MKKVNKGHTGFVVGIVVYILVSLILVLSAVGLLASASKTYGPEADAMRMAALALIVVFVGVSLWFISFTTAFRQRKTEIELLESLVAQGMGDSI